LILSTRPCLGLLSAFFPFGFPNNNLYASLFSLHSFYMTSPSHPPWLVHTDYIWGRVQVMKLIKMGQEGEQTNENILYLRVWKLLLLLWLYSLCRALVVFQFRDPVHSR
jgi:hypothetical protein